jgi:hypothetical protein
MGRRPSAGRETEAMGEQTKSVASWS